MAAGIPAVALLLAAAVLSAVAIFLHPATRTQALSTLGSEWGPQAMGAGLLLLAAGLATVPRFRLGSGTLAVGFSLAVFGINLSNSVQDLHREALASGTTVLWIGWALGLLGGLVAPVAGRGAAPAPSRVPLAAGQRQRRILLLVAVVIASVLMGIALLPSWDRTTLVSLAEGAKRVQYEGSAFTKGQPGLVTAGDIIAAVTFALLPIIGFLTRRVVPGVLLALGTVWVVAAQSLSAVTGLWWEARDFQNGMAGQLNNARAAQLEYYPTLTVWFDVEVIAAFVLVFLLFWRWYDSRSVVAASGSTLMAAPVTSGSGGIGR